jgi:endo-1,3-1,4-beta-glycanase ExoK
MPSTARLAEFLSILSRARTGISRLAGKSPEGTGAVAALAVVAAFVPLMAVAGGSLRAEAAKVVAANAGATEPATSVAAAEDPALSPAAALPLPRTLEQTGEPFIDRFEGVALDEGRWFVSDGWSNGDWMENDWRRSQVTITPGGLQLMLGPGSAGSDKPLASAEIRTHAEFRYGYFEVRMRVPRDPGLVTGVFTYTGAEGRAKPNEIDIEILGRDTRRIELTIHENGRPTSSKIALPFDAANGFHTYAIEWLPDVVRWYADGAMIHEQSGRAAANLTRPQQFILSPWASRQLDEWVGELDPSGGPWTLDVACAAYAPARPDRALCQ